MKLLREDDYASAFGAASNAPEDFRREYHASHRRFAASRSQRALIAAAPWRQTANTAEAAARQRGV
jgi:hypothetical protein